MKDMKYNKLKRLIENRTIVKGFKTKFYNNYIKIDRGYFFREKGLFDYILTLML